MEYVLAIDQGTHASRALVFDTNGQILTGSLHPVSLSQTKQGWIEQDAEQVFTSVRDSIDNALDSLSPAQRDAIRYCGVTTQRSTVVAWRANGTAASPAINWQDTRGAPQLAHLRSRADAIRKLTGLPLSPHYGATKLHWLHQLLGNDPEIRLGPLAGFLLKRLTSSDTDMIDHTNAQRMQLFDIESLDWSRDLSAWFDVPIEKLPACKPVEYAYGSLENHAIPVTAVCGDQNAAWFSSGRPARDVALVNLGSGAFVLGARQTETVPAGLICSIAYSNQQGCEYAVEGTVNGAGNALQWLQTLRPAKNLTPMLPAWLEEVSTPPLFLNTVGGLGSPWWRQGLQPAFQADIKRLTTAEMAAGVAESILFLVQYNIECMQKEQLVRGLRVSGGLSRIDPLMQKLCDLSGLPVCRSHDPEASARGIAWLAAGRPRDWLPAGTVQHFEPRTDKTLRERYDRFIEQLQVYIQAAAHD